MKATFDNLHKIEREIRNLFYNSRNSQYFLQTVRGQALERRWDKMMTELRGYGVYRDTLKTKQSWIEHCNETGFAPDYDLGDVMC